MDGIGKIGILGSGSWATALAKILMSTQQEINWFVRRPQTITQFKEERHNPNYLTSVPFDTDRIKFFTESDINKFFRASDTIFLVVPSPFVKQFLKRVRNSSMRGKLIINAIKGVVPDENILVSDYLQLVHEVSPENIGVVAGPCHAEEVAKDRMSYLTVGCFDITKAEMLSKVLINDFVRCNVSYDVVGIEYASVLKNIYAIAAGICHGMNYGDNFQSVLIANALTEMSNFVNTVHLVKREIIESVYLGDLLVTAYSQFSRNRTFGNMIGRGFSVKTAQSEMNMIAEGYYGTKCIKELNKRYQVNMPIMDAVYDIIYNKASAQDTIAELAKHFK